MASYRIWNDTIVEPSKVELLLDSSFLMFIVSTPTEKIDSIQESLGNAELVVLNAILDELQRLSTISSTKRAKSARSALNFALGLKSIFYDQGIDVDDMILNYASSHGAAVATLDSELRHRLKAKGVTVVFRRGNLLAIEKS